MPIYEFECKNCNYKFDKLLKTGQNISCCPKCKKKDTKKIISNISSKNSPHQCSNCHNCSKCR